MNNKYKEENERFLKENLESKGIQQLPCGVQYKIITKGSGAIPTSKSTVEVHYKGSLVNGLVFDNSFSRRYPEVFKVTEVIKGWQEALKAMPAGSRWKIFIPYNLGYGSKGSGKIKPYSTLIFEVELLSVK